MTTLFPTLEPSVPSPLERARRRLDELEREYISLGAGPEGKEQRQELMKAMIEVEREVANLERMAIRG